MAVPTAHSATAADGMKDVLTIGELRQLAEERVQNYIWDYAMGGSASETTLRRNRAALDRVALQQRVLVDVTAVDIGASFLGLNLPSPLVVAPIGGLYQFHPEGDVEMARGAGRDGSLSTVTGVCGWPMEDIAAAASGPLLFQLYHFGDRAWVSDRLARVESCAAYKAVCLTVDLAVYSRRDRDLANRHRPREHPNLPEPQVFAQDYDHPLTWDDVEWLRHRLTLPFGLKGIATAVDAQRAVDAGVDFIWVSNHGGRQLDDARATIDVLPEIVQSVAGRVPLIVDGGVQRGTDVLKGIALGATLVAMGKASVWGFAAGGANGIARLLAIMQQELRVGLCLSGQPVLRELTPEAVRHIDY